VADAELNKLLVAQRREMDPRRRREIVDDIQRYLVDKAYYVYLPWQPQYIAHQPAVKGFRHHDGYGLGYRLMHTWLER
jgi:ABC-type transport system substrate-binding protein